MGLCAKIFEKQLQADCGFAFDIGMAIAKLEYQVERAQMLQHSAEEQTNSFLNIRLQAEEELEGLNQTLRNCYVSKIDYDITKQALATEKSKMQTLREEVARLSRPWWSKLLDPLTRVS